MFADFTGHGKWHRHLRYSILQITFKFYIIYLHFKHENGFNHLLSKYCFLFVFQVVCRISVCTTAGKKNSYFLMQATTCYNNFCSKLIQIRPVLIQTQVSILWRTPRGLWCIISQYIYANTEFPKVCLFTPIYKVKYFKNAIHLLKPLQKSKKETSMLKTVFGMLVSRSTVFLLFTPVVTYKYLGLMLQLFVANLQQIPQLSHCIGYTGCGHSLLARSSLARHIHQLMCACFILVRPEMDKRRDNRGCLCPPLSREGEKDSHIAC